MLKSPVPLREAWGSISGYLLSQHQTNKALTTWFRYPEKLGEIVVTQCGKRQIGATMVDFRTGRTVNTNLTLEGADNYGMKASCKGMACPTVCQHVLGLAVLVTAESHRLGIMHPDILRASLGTKADDLVKHIHAGQSTNMTAMFAGASPSTEVVAPAKRQARVNEWWLDFLAAADTQEAEEVLYRATKRQADGNPPRWHLADVVQRIMGGKNRVDALENFNKVLGSRIGGYYSYLRFDVDEDLDRFLASDEWRAEKLRLEHGGLELALENWLKSSSRQAQADHTDSVEARWELHTTGAKLPVLMFQVLATSRRLKREPRKAASIEGLIRDIECAKKSMPREQADFLREVHEFRDVQSKKMHSWDLTPQQELWFSIPNPIEWLTKWGSAGLTRWGDESEAVLGQGQAALSIQAGPKGPAWAFTIGPGRTVPLIDSKLFFSGPVNRHGEYERLYVRDGSTIYPVYAAGMPLDLVIGLRASGLMPIENLRKNGLGAELVRRLPIAASINPAPEAVPAPHLVCRVPVESEVALVLVEDELFRIRATASDMEGRQFHRAGNSIWQERSVKSSHEEHEMEAMEDPRAITPDADPATREHPPAAHVAHALAVLPREEDIKLLDQWLGELPWHLAERHDGTGHQWKMTPAMLSTLLRLWPVRPAGVRYLGNAAFKNLITVRRIPKFDFNIENSGTDWLKVSIEWEGELDALDLDRIGEVLKASGDELLMLPGGHVYDRSDLERYYQKAAQLNKMGLEIARGHQNIHPMQLAGADASVLQDLEGIGTEMEELARRTRQLVQEFRGVPPVQPPVETEAVARPYQRDGIAYLVWAARTLGGALLADDMGLGKTLQVLAALAILRESDVATGPALVLCPASVANNWKREAHKFVPGLRVAVVERGAARKQIYEQLDQYDIVVSNYALARRDEVTLAKTDWHAIVVDEAQAIKNPAADITRAVKRLNARYRFALTGTPIENRLGDLVSILDFAAPGFVRVPVGLDRASNPRPEAWRILRSRVRPVVLRRLKSEVARDLPPRIEERQDCEMTPKQKTIYLAEVKRTRELLGQAKGQSIAGPARIQLLAALMRLRQICCDPALIDHPKAGSGKVEQLLEFLPGVLEAGHKVLVFSQFVTMIELLEPRLKKAKIPFRKLTGQTPPEDRQELVDSFEKDKTPGIFLISLKAGGSGLNLTSASHVVLFDPWWNPAVEAQAIDRTHRIGQDKTVLAFRLVTLGTIEERILELQERKKAIVKNVLEEESFNRMLSREDFEYLLADSDE